MSTEALRKDLIDSLKDIYQLHAFGALEDLLQGESLILRYLAMHQDRETYPSDLSRELRLSRSRITGALTSLRAKGLVAMEHDQQDRRRVRVFITPEGAALILEKLSLMDRYFDQMIDGIGQEDTAQLIRIIGRCVEVMHT